MLDWLKNRAFHLPHSAAVAIAKTLHADPTVVQFYADLGTAIVSGKAWDEIQALLPRPKDSTVTPPNAS